MATSALVYYAVDETGDCVSHYEHHYRRDVEAPSPIGKAFHTRRGAAAAAEAYLRSVDARLLLPEPESPFLGHAGGGIPIGATYATEFRVAQAVVESGHIDRRARPFLSDDPHGFEPMAPSVEPECTRLRAAWDARIVARWNETQRTNVDGDEIETTRKRTAVAIDWKPVMQPRGGSLLWTDATLYIAERALEWGDDEPASEAT